MTKRILSLILAVLTVFSLCAPAFASVNPQPARQAAPQPAAPKPEQPAPVKKYVEPSAAFAEGLPEWSIEPPQVVVRRR